jgi:WD40 repeat protein
LVQTSRTFRVFISSTFSDLIAERNALQEKVFPRLRELAATHGCRFQAIDLRWGVSEEAALNQQTMKICLGEIARCQKTSPRPNFIVLLGDRYGWRPLPSEIPGDEFERILPLVSAEDKIILGQWYRRDDNAVPAVYCLLPRGDDHVEYTAWAQVENQIRHILLNAVKQLGLPPEAELKYTASATEQEIVAGALRVENAREHVFGYFREIHGLSQAEGCKDYLDAETDAVQQQVRLKERLRQQLVGNTHDYQAVWQMKSPSLDHLDQLCEDVYTDLSKVIFSEAGMLKSIDPLDREISAHKDFGEERARVFIGRADLLKSITEYIQGSDNHTLLIWGVSGSGKSTLMAKAVELARSGRQEVIHRFIGATPESSNGRSLLESLCRQISRRYGADESTLPLEYKDLVQEFSRRLALAETDKPLILFLDALDQLSEADTARGLAWLPSKLPAYTRLIVSALPGECLKALQSRVPGQVHLEVPPLSAQDGRNILDAWLDEAHRTLQPEQLAVLLGKFEACGLPLYSKLAFNEARLWKSYDPLPDLGGDIAGILQDLFDRLSLESNHGSVLVSRSLSYLAAAKNGLSEDELLDVLSIDEQVLADFQRRSPNSPKADRLPVVLWSRLYLDLEPYLVERSADGAHLMAFYHRQMSEAVSSRYLSEEEKPTRHRKLAEFFASEPLQPENGVGKIRQLRKFSEQPFQQAMAGMNGEFVATVTNYVFMQAKVEALGIHPLIDDYDLAALFSPRLEDEASLRLIEEALQLSLHVLNNDPRQLGGQLLGRLRGENDPRIGWLLEQVEQWKGFPWVRPLSRCLTSPGGPLLHSIASKHSNQFTIAGTRGQLIVAVNDVHNVLDIWDMNTGIKLHSLPGHTTYVDTLATTPDGKQVVTGSRDYTIKIWDVESGILIRTLAGHKDWVNVAVITPDGRRIISGAGDSGKGNSLNSKDNTIKIWDLESGAELFTLAGHTMEICRLVISPDGRCIVSASSDHTIRLWDLGQRMEIRTLSNGYDWPGVLDITPDSRTVIADTGMRGTENRTVKVWNLENGKELFSFQKSRFLALTTLNGHNAIVVRTLSSTGSTGNSNRDNALMVAWDIESGAKVWESRCPEASMRVMPGGRRGVLFGYHILEIWDLERGVLIWSRYSENIRDVAVGLDGCHIATIGDDTIKVWNIDREEKHHPALSPTSAMKWLRVTPDGERVLSGSEDQSISVWDLNCRVKKSVIPNAGTLSAFLPSSDSFVSVNQGGIYIWNMETGVKAKEIRGDIPQSMVMVTPDGRKIVSSDNRQTTILWDVNNAKELCRFPDSGPLQFVSPNGRFAVCGSSLHTIKVLDLEKMVEMCTLPECTTSYPGGITATPDGQRIISIHYPGRQTGGRLSVWELNTGMKLREMSPAVEGTATVTPDGRYVICDEYHGGFDSFNTFGVWELDSGKYLYSMEGHFLGATPDGQYAISVPKNKKGILTVWDLNKGMAIAKFDEENNFGVHAITPDGLSVIVGDDISGQVQILKLENIFLGPFVVTAWNKPTKSRLFWKHGPISDLAYDCPRCHSWNGVYPESLGMDMSCPRCKTSIRLNPFTMTGNWQSINGASKGI